MKFYVNELAEGDSKIAGPGFYPYDTLKEAMAAYHRKMATAMSSDLYKSEQIIVFNSDNGIHVQDKYINKDYVEPQPEPQVVEYDDMPEFEVPVMDDVPSEVENNEDPVDSNPETDVQA